MLGKLGECLAISLSLGICFQNISIAVGNIFFVIAIIISCIFLYKNRVEVLTIENCVDDYKCDYKMLLILMVSMIPSVIFSCNFGRSLNGFLDMWIYRTVPFWIVTFILNDKKVIERMLSLSILAIGIESIVAIYRYFIEGVNRGYGFANSPMKLSAFLAILIPLVTVMILDKDMDRNLKRVGIFCYPFLLLAAIIGQSRGLWITLAIVLPVIVFKYALKSKKVVVITFCLFVGVMLLFSNSPKYYNRILSSTNITTNVSNVDRLWIWKSSINMIKDYPISGVGLRCFTTMYRSSYMLPEIKQKHLSQAHNNFLQISAEAGLIGGLSFLLYSMFIVISNFLTWVNKNNPYALSLFGVWLAFSVFGVIDATIVVSSLAKFLWFLTGSLIVLKYKR